MTAFESKILSLNETEIELLITEMRNRIKSFLMILLSGSIGILIVIIGIAEIYHFPGYRIITRTSLSHALKIAPLYYTLFAIWMLIFYKNSIYPVTKDLSEKTKRKFKTKIAKLDTEHPTSKKAKFCEIILTPSNKISSYHHAAKSLVEGLFLFYWKKYIFPEKLFIIRVPPDIYAELQSGEGIIEIGTYSNTFFDYQEISPSLH